MPAKKLRQPKQVREKLPGAAISKLRKTQSEPTSTVDGKRLGSLIPVVRKRGRPSLASKFDPTVDINDALKRLGKGFFTGEEKDLFKTPLKVGPAESQKQRQSAAGLSSSPARSNKRGAGRSRSSSLGSPGSKASSDSPYFLRSKGAADDVVDDSVLQPKRRQKSAGLDSAEKKSPARKPKSTGLDSAEKGTPARKTKSGGLDSAEKGTPSRKTKSGGLDSAEKKSPARKGRKSFQSPPHKKAEAEKPVSLVKASRASFSGRKDDNLEKSVLDKERVKSVKKDAAETTAIVRTPAKSRRQTKTSQDLASENEAEEVVRVETGKKRKREEDVSSTDDPKTKRAKVMIVDSEKIREMAQEANQRTTLKLMVHRANIEDLGDKMVLNSGGDQASYRRLVPYEEKRRTPASALNEVSQTKRGQSRTTEVTVVTSSHSMSSRNRSSIFEPTDNTALAGSVQRLNEASRDLDETARRQLHDLTANISVRDSWSAHLYDTGSRSASRLPRASAAGNSQRMSMDALRPLSAVTPSVDFQVNWDTSAVKEQLLSSVRPQKVWADELATVKMVTATEANSQPRSKGMLEKPQANELDTVPVLVTAQEKSSRPNSKGLLEKPRADTVLLDTVPMLVTAREANSRPSNKGLLEESAVIFTSSVATPLRRPDIDKPVFERDGVEFGENMRLRSSRKTVVTEEKTEIRRRPSGNYSAVPFNTPVQQLRGNGASVRHSVDRMLPPAVDRVNVVRGRSVEPGMIRSESIQRQPKFNGQMAMKELNPVVEVRGGRCGRVCRRSLCLVGTSVLAIGAVCLVHLALAAGYLGELF